MFARREDSKGNASHTGSQTRYNEDELVFLISVRSIGLNNCLRKIVLPFFGCRFLIKPTRNPDLDRRNERNTNSHSANEQSGRVVYGVAEVVCLNSRRQAVGAGECCYMFVTLQLPVMLL